MELVVVVGPFLFGLINQMGTSASPDLGNKLNANA